jgi:hypothetical protein
VAGKVPDELAKQFAADTFELKAHELAEKYNIAISTVKDWRLDCRRRLGLETGYGIGRPTNTSPIIEGVMADEEYDIDEIVQRAANNMESAATARLV